MLVCMLYVEYKMMIINNNNNDTRTYSLIKDESEAWASHQVAECVIVNELGYEMRL